LKWLNGTMKWEEFSEQLTKKLEDESIKNSIKNKESDSYDKIG